MKKKILITGKNGYVGNRLENHLRKQGYSVDLLNVRGNDWQEINFSIYNVVIHLAAIVHNNLPSATMVDYMNINYHLTRNLAEKAKLEGVD